MRMRNSATRRAARAKPVPAYRKKDWIAAYLFIAPMTLGILVFVLLPIFFSVILSFAKWDGLNLGNLQWVGLQNFRELLTTDVKAGIEFRNTLFYTFISVPLTIAVSCVVSVALVREVKYASVFRCIYYLPNVTMPVAVALVWAWMFNSQYGLIKQLLSYAGIVMPNVLGNPSNLMYMVILVTVWKGIGANMIILIAGLQGIPQEYYESAEIDGADAMARFFKITLPLITPSVFFLTVTGLMSGFKSFDLVYTFAGSGAISTTLVDGVRTMVFGIYKSAFQDMRMGFASAKAIALFAMIMAVTLIQFGAQKRWVHYD